MALAAKMLLRQGQSLVMTPQLLQAIKLLQYSSIELAAFVEDELERNPLLEREDSDRGDEEPVALEPIVAAEEPLLAASEDEELMELRAALFRLPDDYREPLVLQVLMGYSTAEIAAELGLSNAAVLTRLFRARRQLRALCGEDTSLDPQE